MIYDTYLCLSTAAFLSLSVIWTKKTPADLICKTLAWLLGVLGAILVSDRLLS